MHRTFRCEPEILRCFCGEDPDLFLIVRCFNCGVEEHHPEFIGKHIGEFNLADVFGGET